MKTAEEYLKEKNITPETKHHNYDYVYHSVFGAIEQAQKDAFKEGQSSPKIKQLEWVEVNSLGEIGIEAKTPFGNYEVYEKSDHDGYILWWFDPKPYVFDTEIEAKMYAQADFEKRIKECLE
ncbi:MAG: hypothetical protein ACOYIG_09485 [Acetivibrionales bacterium]|jgi:hypothetical protein